MKQYISSLLFLLFTSVVTAQVKSAKGFIISGQLQNAAHQMVYLRDASNSDSKPYSDSMATDASGGFTFRGRVPDPRLFELRFNSEPGVNPFYRELLFYVDNSSIHLNGNADSLSKVKISGSKALAIQLRQRIDKEIILKAGSIAPDFSQPDTAGVAVALSGFTGKYVLLDFWASWCSPCRAENPNLVKAYEKYKDCNFTIVSVSMDDNKASWLKAVRNDHLPWVQLSDLKGAANEAVKLYGIKTIPANFLIDPRGKILASNLRGEDLINFLDKLVAR